MSASKKTSLAKSTQNLISTIKQNRDRYIAFAFASAHLFLEVDRTGTITYAAGASSALRKGPSYTLLGEKFIQFIVAADRDYFKEILKHLFIHHRIDPRPLKLNTASGHEITLMVGGFIMPDSPSTINLAFTIPPKSVGAGSHHKKDEETGLLDKKVFADAAKEQLETSNRMGQESKLTMFVIDGLEEISKTGDPFALSRALDKIAAYMRAISLDGGTATQFDTEKFGLLHGANVTEEEVRTRINEIVEEELDGATEAKSFAIDFDPGELDEEDAAKALSYSIKKFVEEDPANFSISSLQTSAKEMMSDTLSRISNVREIIEKKNFDVVYQPIVDLYMEEPHHLEALTRVTGLSSPQSFITFTEEVGLIEDFDLALAQKVLDDLDNHAKSGWRPKVAINISARSMSSKIFLDGFKEVLKPFDNVKKQLMLELTETVAVSNFEKLNKTLFKDGVMFDGSSIAGWKAINESDMILMPDPETAVMDPFTAQPQLILFCDILEPSTGLPYDRDPRSIAKKALAYTESLGIGDTVYFGPEAEFFIFDDARWSTEQQQMSYSLDSEEGPYNSNSEYEGGNMGHRPGHKGGYFPVAPVDSGTDIRAEMVSVMIEMGLEMEKHHHEVAPSQHELGMKFSTLIDIADKMQIFKYVTHMVAHSYGKTATFMPKPIVNDNGSGMQHSL